MSDRSHKRAGGAPPPLEDATAPAELPPAVDGWDDATRLDPPGGTDELIIPPEGGSNTESTAAQEIIAALGKALRSPLPGRALDEEETVGLFGDPPGAKPSLGPKIPASPTQPARRTNVAKPADPKPADAKPTPRAATAAGRPPASKSVPPSSALTAPMVPSKSSLPAPSPLTPSKSQLPAPAASVAKLPAPIKPAPKVDLTSEAPLSWDEPSISTDAAVAALPKSGAPSGPFGVDSTELDLNLWAVGDSLHAPSPSTSPVGQRSPVPALHQGWSDPTAKLQGPPSAHGLEPPPWEDSMPWETKNPLSAKLPPAMHAPLDYPRSGPVLNADGVIEHEPARSREPAGATPSGAPRVIVGRPVEDPSEAPRRAPGRAPTRVVPAGPASLQEPALPSPETGFEGDSSTNTFARFGNIAVSKKRTFDFFRRIAPKNEANPGSRPGGVGIPVGAERRRYRVLLRMLAIAGVLIIGVLIGFLITVSLKG
ncbi:hypothetical protein L6R52_37110 [Myxococcota bacterium]|nr:hypothetical protein [Myxococcota bacterium]